MALAFVAAHRVHTDLLTASVVDTALVGVCGTKQPITDPADTILLLKMDQDGRYSLNKGKVLTAFRMCTWHQLTPLPTQGISWHEPH